jgi:hypothetical protein
VFAGITSFSRVKGYLTPNCDPLITVIVFDPEDVERTTNTPDPLVPELAPSVTPFATTDPLTERTPVSERHILVPPLEVCQHWMFRDADSPVGVYFVTVNVTPINIRAAAAAIVARREMLGGEDIEFI